MSELTPRTDAAAIHTPIGDVVLADDTRVLERENAALRERVARLEQTTDIPLHHLDYIRTLEKRVADLEGKTLVEPYRNHPWCQPGDRPDRAWILRFDDRDVREQQFHGPDAEEQATKAWEQWSRHWNCYLFAAVPRAALAVPAGAKS